VVCLQETKLADDAFASCSATSSPSRGYEVAVHGEAAWNGVAILSRVGPGRRRAGLAGGPGFPHQEARAVSPRAADPRGLGLRAQRAQPGSEHYEYKLAWLASLREMVAAGPRRRSSAAT
jgi:exodeoxyribonuclease-3